MRIARILPILSFFTLLSASAVEPKYVLLQSLFTSTREFQIGGSCHAYAAAIYLEGECKRRTGKNIHVSEAYALYQHYVNQAGIPETGTAQNPVRTRTLQSVRDTEYHMWGKMDAGDPVWDLQTMIEGDVCEASLFPSMPVLQKILMPFRNVLDYVDQNSRKIPILQHAKKIDNGHIDDLFGQYLFDHFGKNVNPEGLKSTHSEGLRECLKQLQDPSKFHEEPFNRKKAYQLLDAGRPFICRSGAELITEPQSNHVKLFGGKSRGHSSVVAGYQIEPRDKKHPRTWMLRDSNYPDFVLATGQCSTMIWID